MAADLHTHTTASDGLVEPGEVVAGAARRGLRAIAITDHDTVGGVSRAITAGVKWGIEVIPGIEMNTNYRNREVHVLGYFFDYTSGVLLEQLKCIREMRTNRITAMVDKLVQLGVNISRDEVFTTSGGSVPGRPHIARTLVAKNVVASVGEAFDEYVGEDGIAFVPRRSITPIEAVQLIKSLGGVSVLAHPGLIGDDGIIDELAAAGLQGLEVFHPEHTSEQREHYHLKADSLGLIVTGGSDYHGPELKHRQLGAATVDYGTVKRLKELSVYYGKSGKN